jgi:hypothetical protein
LCLCAARVNGRLFVPRKSFCTCVMNIGTHKGLEVESALRCGLRFD